MSEEKGDVGRPKTRGEVIMVGFRFPAPHADYLAILSHETDWTKTDILCKAIEMFGLSVKVKPPDGLVPIEFIRSTRPLLPSERLRIRKAQLREEEKTKNAQRKARRKR